MSRKFRPKEKCASRKCEAYVHISSYRCETTHLKRKKKKGGNRGWYDRVSNQFGIARCTARKWLAASFSHSWRLIGNVYFFGKCNLPSDKKPSCFGTSLPLFEHKAAISSAQNASRKRKLTFLIFRTPKALYSVPIGLKMGGEGALLHSLIGVMKASGFGGSRFAPSVPLCCPVQRYNRRMYSNISACFEVSLSNFSNEKFPESS